MEFDSKRALLNLCAIFRRTTVTQLGPGSTSHLFECNKSTSIQSNWYLPYSDISASITINKASFPPLSFYHTTHNIFSLHIFQYQTLLSPTDELVQHTQARNYFNLLTTDTSLSPSTTSPCNSTPCFTFLRPKPSPHINAFRSPKSRVWCLRVRCQILAAPIRRWLSTVKTVVMSTTVAE